MSAKLKTTIVFILALVAMIITILSISFEPKTASASSAPYTLTVVYKDRDGNAVANNKYIKTDGNGKYNLSIVNITGYSFFTSSIPMAGTLTEDSTITMIYEPVKLQIKVIYVDEQGVAIKGAPNKTYYVTLHDYMQLDLTKVKIDGYRYSGDNEIIPITTVGGTTIKLTYVKDDGAREGSCSSSFNGNEFGLIAVGLSSLAILGILLKIRRRKNG